jgi:hypothetical protein
MSFSFKYVNLVWASILQSEYDQRFNKKVNKKANKKANNKINKKLVFQNQP